MLSGNLAEFPLLGLLQTLMASGRGGALTIQHPRFQAHLYLRAGNLVHAEAGHLRGMAALELTAGLKNAPFRFEAEKAAAEETIQPGLETHRRLLELFDHWELLHLPADWSAALRSAKAPGPAQPSPKDLALLGLADGRTLADLLMNGRVGPLESAQILDRMLSQGVLEVRSAVNVKPEQLVVLSLYGTAEGVAVLDRDLFGQWHQQCGPGFAVRLRAKAQEALLKAQVRTGLEGRVGLFESDMRRLRVGRGTPVEVWPEAHP